MKKIISIILCVAVLISITACNGNSNEKKEENNIILLKNTWDFPSSIHIFSAHL